MEPCDPHPLHIPKPRPVCSPAAPAAYFSQLSSGAADDAEHTIMQRTPRRSSADIPRLSTMPPSANLTSSCLGGLGLVTWPAQQQQQQQQKKKKTVHGNSRT
jgi:hypothetical protein